MKRVRISTTVDAQAWERASSLLKLPSSRLVDRALKALIEEIEADREEAALREMPYEDDPDLNWTSPDIPDLPYQGEIPREVLKLARDRRRIRK